MSVRRRLMAAIAGGQAPFSPYVIGPTNKTFDSNVDGWSDGTFGAPLDWVSAPYGIAPGALRIGFIDFWGSYLGEATSGVVPAEAGWVVKIDARVAAEYPDGWSSVDWMNGASHLQGVPAFTPPVTTALQPVSFTTPPAPNGTTGVRVRIGTRDGYTYVDDVYLTRMV